MKVIETIYNGYRFRNRLEAKWAVFFDYLGIKYQYEKEGFEFDCGTKYLPDFYLPEYKIWFEIKLEKPTGLDEYNAYILANGRKEMVVIAYGDLRFDESLYNQIGKTPIGLDGYLGDPENISTLWNIELDKKGGLSQNEYSEGPEYKYINTIDDSDFRNYFCCLSAFLSYKLDIEIGYNGSPKSAKKLIDLDKQYYREKYKKEHPHYIYGIKCEVAFEPKGNKITIYGCKFTDGDLKPYNNIIDAMNYASTYKF